MGASDRPRPDDHRPHDDRHLSEDEFNRYLDGDLDSAERVRANAHLSHCADCRSSLADVQMLAALLRDLPQVDVPRSFQLGPEFAPPASLWDRLAALLLPMLPAMRATTVALVLMLGGVTAYRIAEDQPSTGPVSELAVPATTTSVVGGVPAVATNTPASTETPQSNAAQKAPEPTESASRKTGNNAAADESGAGAAAPAQSGPSDAEAPTSSSASESSGSTELQLPGQAQPASTGSAEESSSSGASDTTIMVAAEPASPTASPTLTASPSPSPTPSPSATPSPTDTPAPTPTIGPVSTGTGNQTWLGLAQAILAAGILILGGLVIGLTHFRKQVP